MNLEQYKQQFTTDDSVGWYCIDKALAKIYPQQKPQHFAPVPHYALGGESPIDGISVYNSDKQSAHFHFITYGFSDLYYDEECAGNEFSGFGFELTFRLKKQPNDNDVQWVCHLLQNLAKYVFDTGNFFDEFHFIPAYAPIRAEYDTDMTALAFVLDPELGKIDTPHGEVMFLQMVGLTNNEYEQLKQNPLTKETAKLIEILKQNNQYLTQITH